MTNTLDVKTSSTIQKDNNEKRKAGIRKKSVNGREVVRGKKVYRPKMTVPVGKSFEKLIEMNEKAIKIIAKRA